VALPDRATTIAARALTTQPVAVADAPVKILRRLSSGSFSVEVAPSGVRVIRAPRDVASTPADQLPSQSTGPLGGAQEPALDVQGQAPASGLAPTGQGRDGNFTIENTPSGVQIIRNHVDHR
jgi:hypothetical protein